MIEELLVYFVTRGPISEFCSDGTEVWYVETQASDDGGKTVKPMVFTFEIEEDATQFKREVNSQMEPLKLGEYEDE